MAPRIEDFAVDQPLPSVGPVTSYASGQKFAPFASPILLELPALTAPFGVSIYAGKPTLSLNLTPSTAEPLASLDREARKLISKIPKLIGRSTITEDLLDVVYSPIVKPASDEKYPPLIKLALKDFKHDGINSGYEAGEYRRHLVRSIIEIPGLWISSTKIGLLVKLRRIHVSCPEITSQDNWPVFEEPH
jgi:hypothetical protein